MSTQKLQTTDLFLVNRAADSYKSTYGDFKTNVLDSHIIQSDTPPTYPDIVAGTIWVDTSQDPPVLHLWDGTQWVEIQGGAQVVDPDRTTDISFNPPVTGTGTANDPFVLTTVTCFTVGGTVTSNEVVSLINQPASTLFEIENLSGEARFTQPFALTNADGEWSGKLTYTDTPDSAAGDTYESLFNIGTECYIKWVVVQIANQTPIVGSDGTTQAPNASPPSVDIGGSENLYGTGTGTWADGAGTLRTIASSRFANNDAILFGVDGGTIDKTDKVIADGQTIVVQFDEATVNAANDGDTISGAITNDDGFYQEWVMVKDTNALAFTIAPLVDQALSTAVVTGNNPIQGVNAPSEVTLVAGATLTDVEVSVDGAAFTSTFPVTFNPGDPLQLRGTTGPDNDTEYTATVAIGSTQATWSVTTTDTAASIPQPQITSPANGSLDLDTNVILVSDAYQDNGTGAGAHTESDWEVYETDVDIVKSNKITDVDGTAGILSYKTDTIQSVSEVTTSDLVTATLDPDYPNATPYTLDSIFDGNTTTHAYYKRETAVTFTFNNLPTGTEWEIFCTGGAAEVLTHVTFSDGTTGVLGNGGFVKFTLSAPGTLQSIEFNGNGSGQAIGLSAIKVDGVIITAGTILTFPTDENFDKFDLGDVVQGGISNVISASKPLKGTRIRGDGTIANALLYGLRINGEQLIEIGTEYSSQLTVEGGDWDAGSGPENAFDADLTNRARGGDFYWKFSPSTPFINVTKIEVYSEALSGYKFKFEFDGHTGYTETLESAGWYEVTFELVDPEVKIIAKDEDATPPTITVDGGDWYGSDASGTVGGDTKLVKDVLYDTALTVSGDKDLDVLKGGSLMTDGVKNAGGTYDLMPYKLVTTDIESVSQQTGVIKWASDNSSQGWATIKDDVAYGEDGTLGAGYLLATDGLRNSDKLRFKFSSIGVTITSPSVVKFNCLAKGGGGWTLASTNVYTDQGTLTMADYTDDPPGHANERHGATVTVPAGTTYMDLDVSVQGNDAMQALGALRIDGVEYDLWVDSDSPGKILTFPGAVSTNPDLQYFLPGDVLQGGAVKINTIEFKGYSSCHWIKLDGEYLIGNYGGNCTNSTGNTINSALPPAVMFDGDGATMCQNIDKTGILIDLSSYKIYAKTFEVMGGIGGVGGAGIGGLVINGVELTDGEYGTPTVWDLSTPETKVISTGYPNSNTMVVDGGEWQGSTPTPGINSSQVWSSKWSGLGTLLDSDPAERPKVAFDGNTEALLNNRLEVTEVYGDDVVEFKFDTDGVYPIEVLIGRRVNAANPVFNGVENPVDSSDGIDGAEWVSLGNTINGENVFSVTATKGFSTENNTDIFGFKIDGDLLVDASGDTHVEYQTNGGVGNVVGTDPDNNLIYVEETGDRDNRFIADNSEGKDFFVSNNQGGGVPPAPVAEPPGSDFTKVDESLADTSNLTSYTPSGLNDGKAYFSRVKYRDDTAPDAVESEWSPWNGFTTEAP